MTKAFLIEVAHKPGITDPVGHGLAHDINHLGIAHVKKVASAQLYRIEGQLSSADRKRIAEDLLCDPILQDYREEGDLSPAGEGIAVDIWYKQGVTDSVGESVLKGIKDLNIAGAESVRTGMRYHLHGVGRRDVAEKIANALLANPLVHDAIIHAD